MEIRVSTSNELIRSRGGSTAERLDRLFYNFDIRSARSLHDELLHCCYITLCSRSLSISLLTSISSSLLFRNEIYYYITGVSIITILIIYILSYRYIEEIYSNAKERASLNITKITFNHVVLPSSYFLGISKILPFEECTTSHVELAGLKKEQVCFISHKWFENLPDKNNLLLDFIKRTILINNFKFIWLDYTSVPQSPISWEAIKDIPEVIKLTTVIKSSLNKELYSSSLWCVFESTYCDQTIVINGLTTKDTKDFRILYAALVYRLCIQRTSISNIFKLNNAYHSFFEMNKGQYY